MIFSGYGGFSRNTDPAIIFQLGFVQRHDIRLNWSLEYPHSPVTPLLQVDVDEPVFVVEFGEVLLLGGESVIVGSPTVSGALVAGEVVSQGRGAKVIAFKKRRRKNSRRKRSHRQEYSLVRITEILTEGKKPSQSPPPRPKREPRPKPEETAAAEQPAA